MIYSLLMPFQSANFLYISILFVLQCASYDCFVTTEDLVMLCMTPVSGLWGGGLSTNKQITQIGSVTQYYCVLNLRLIIIMHV